MRRHRVLIVDDVMTVRRLVIEALAPDPALLVVGTAENGRTALAKIPILKPDILILDIEMPVMGGLETLVEVRKSYPDLPVIVFTSDSDPGAEASLDALWLGASDYVVKSSADNSAAALRHIQAELVPRIKHLCAGARASGPPRHARAAKTSDRPGPARAAQSRPAIQLLAIGASTGGPDALTTVLGDLPADFPVPIVVVQHMPRLFTRFLAERLASKTAIHVVEAADGDVIAPGQAWIAPGEWHMTLARAGASVRIRLDQGPPINSCRPSVDSLFLSAAEIFGPGVLGVVLTGMGQDGLRGCERIRWSRGQVLVQDEATSVVWGMPGNVSRAGLADRVLPLQKLPAEIIQRVYTRRMRRPAAA